VERLSHYPYAWVWPPSFSHTWAHQELRRAIAMDGVQEPLVILPNGQVIDGGHRLDLARELGITEVPVHVVPVELPLDDDQRMLIEEWAAIRAIARRQLTQQQIIGLLMDLDEAVRQWDRERVSRANLRRGTAPPRPVRLVERTQDLAELTGWSASLVKRLLAIARRGSSELAEQVRSGKRTVDEAHRALLAELRGTSEAPAPVADLAPEAMFAEFRRRLLAFVHIVPALAEECVAMPRPVQEAFLERLYKALDAVQEVRGVLE
jgi:hypothetical protein